MEPVKNSGPNGIWTHDLCDTGAAIWIFDAHLKRRNKFQVSTYSISACRVKLSQTFIQPQVQEILMTNLLG